MCEQIAAGTALDVIEIDAASNGSVDDVRALRDKVGYSPAQATKKVYIVDECHMLSTAGWNAFLKTVEEPPGHVLFVFATTEPHKVPATILSRTQRFDFRNVPADELAAHCRTIAAAEAFTIDDAALAQVVAAGDGSVRDTLSVLDRVVAFTGETVTGDGTAQALGVTDIDTLDALIDAVADGNVGEVCIRLSAATDAGCDLRQLATELVETFHSVLLTQVVADGSLVAATAERRRVLHSYAGRFTRSALLRTVELLGEALGQMRRGQSRLPFELALIKAAMPEASYDPAALASRIEELERTVAQLTAGQSLPAAPVAPVPEAASDAAAPDADAAPSATPASTADVAAQWEEILAHVHRNDKRAHALLKPATPAFTANQDGGGSVELRYDPEHSFHAEQASNHLPVLATAVHEVNGQPYEVTVAAAQT